MTFDVLPLLSESKLIPHRKNLADYDPQDLADLAYLHILSLRILLHEHDNGIALFAQKYCRKTAQHGHFKSWHGDETDLYVMLYGLIAEPASLAHVERHAHIHMPIDAALLYRWLRAAADKKVEIALTHRVFVKLDSWFRINNSGLRAIRRLVMDWPVITTVQRRLALTRLLQFMRSRAARGEVLPWLNKVAVLRDLEIDNVENQETGEHKEVKESLLRLLAVESATAGATTAASVATVVGGLGAGFDADYAKSIYPPPRPAKPILLRRQSKRTRKTA